MLEVSLPALQNGEQVLQSCRGELYGIQEQLLKVAARLEQGEDDALPRLARSLRQSADALEQDARAAESLARVLAEAEHQFYRTEERLCTRAQMSWQPPHAAAAAQLSAEEIDQLGVHF